MKTVVILGIFMSFFIGFAALEKQDGCTRKRISYRTHEIKQYYPPRTLRLKADEVEACGDILFLYEKGKLVFEDSINHFEVIK